MVASKGVFRLLEDVVRAAAATAAAAVAAATSDLDFSSPPIDGICRGMLYCVVYPYAGSYILPAPVDPPG